MQPVQVYALFHDLLYIFTMPDIDLYKIINSIKYTNTNNTSRKNFVFCQA